MNTGKIIPIAFPDVFVRYSGEFILNYIFPLVGLGRKKYIKAGHAALLLIENKTGKIQYFDFGRYVTPKGKGRVRSAATDVELEVPFKAKILEDLRLGNIEEILVWLEAHPEKSHGAGRMVASVCDDVNYDKALRFLTELQNQGSIPYNAFKKEGSNCSRLVTDTLINSVTDNKIIKSLKLNNRFTPSPLGNVQHGAKRGVMYTVFKGEVKKYTNSVLKENLTNYFDSNVPKIEKTIELPSKIGNAQLLEGIGASAYFELQDSIVLGEYVIKRFTPEFKQDFEGVFKVSDFSFNSELVYQFVYDSNCSYCHVKQNDKVYRFDVIK